MEFLVASAVSALVVGLTGSLHCGLMCGPLACVPRRGRDAVAWHLGRVTAYSVVGAFLGLLGRGVAKTVLLDVQPALPWVMAVGLVMTALDLGRLLKPLPGVRHLSALLVRVGARGSAEVRSFTLGAATPFLPCGLLAGMFLTAIATGSAGGGALVLGAFSLGAIPTLVAVRFGAARVAPPSWLRRAVPLVAAVVLISRSLVSAHSVPTCGSDAALSSVTASASDATIRAK